MSILGISFFLVIHVIRFDCTNAGQGQFRSAEPITDEGYADGDTLTDDGTFTFMMRHEEIRLSHLITSVRV